MVDLWALNPCWLFGRSLFSINNKKVMPVEQICEKNFSVDSHNPNTSNHPTKYRGVISIGLFWFLTTRPFEIRPSKSLDFRSLTFYIRFLNALAFKKTESKSFFRAPLLGRADNWPAFLLSTGNILYCAPWASRPQTILVEYQTCTVIKCRFLWPSPGPVESNQ